MTRRFFKQSTPDGYVIYMGEDYTVTPLRCFGWNQSAAIEFANMLNNKFWERKDMQIKGWAKTFKPEEKYSYPEFKSSGINLVKQKY